MQLSLSDFDSSADPPSWIPHDQWEDLLAISVLPGPLDSLCVQLAENPEEWKEWYKSDKPESVDTPAFVKTSKDDCEYNCHSLFFVVAL
jgi:dynein heavy chain